MIRRVGIGALVIAASVVGTSCVLAGEGASGIHAGGDVRATAEAGGTAVIQTGHGTINVHHFPDPEKYKLDVLWRLSDSTTLDSIIGAFGPPSERLFDEDPAAELLVFSGDGYELFVVQRADQGNSKIGVGVKVSPKKRDLFVPFFPDCDSTDPDTDTAEACTFGSFDLALLARLCGEQLVEIDARGFGFLVKGCPGIPTLKGRKDFNFGIPLDEEPGCVLGFGTLPLSRTLCSGVPSLHPDFVFVYSDDYPNDDDMGKRYDWEEAVHRYTYWGDFDVNEIEDDGGADCYGRVTGQLRVDGNVLVYWKDGMSKGRWRFCIQEEDKDKEMCYELDCLKKKFLWTGTTDLARRDVLDWAEKAEWHSLSHRSTRANSVFDTVCGQRECQ